MLKQIHKEINNPLAKKLETALLSLQSSHIPRNVISHSYDSKVINFISNLGIPIVHDNNMSSDLSIEVGGRNQDKIPAKVQSLSSVSSAEMLKREKSIRKKNLQSRISIEVNPIECVPSPASKYTRKQPEISSSKTGHQLGKHSIQTKSRENGTNPFEKGTDDFNYFNMQNSPQGVY